MGIPILYGRAIDEHDNLKGARAVVVNQEFGQMFFQRENAVGITFAGSDKVMYQIVGVCADWQSRPIARCGQTLGLQRVGAGASCWSRDL